MAIIDAERDLVVIRIVYDGPPGAGKTASLYALQKSLKTPQPVFSAHQAAGNDEHQYDFDWLDYTGGMFEHRQIRCQILSTPGDPLLSTQREYLLQTADAVVFVVDSRASALSLGLKYFNTLQNILKARPTSPPKILIQANYQDDPEAFDEERLAAFFEKHLRIYGSVAVKGESIRESFVFAVRLALEHVTQLQTEGALETGQVDINSGEHLFELFQQRDWTVNAEQQVLHQILDAETPHCLPDSEAVNATPTEVQGTQVDVALCQKHLPGADTPLQWLSPPLATKAVLQNINTAELHFHAVDEPVWMAEHASAKWRYFSRVDWHYPNENAARNVLRQQFQWHLRYITLFPEHRYLALSQCEDEQFHLWQIVETHTTLMHYLDTLIQTGDAQQFADQLLVCAEGFSKLINELIDVVSLQNITLDTVHFDGKMAYAGLLDMALGQGEVDEDMRFMHLMKQFSQPISDALNSSLDVRTTLLRLNEHEATHPHLAESLSTLFIQ